MKNGIHTGKVMTYTAPTGGVVSGTPVLIGALLVVPVATVAQTEKFAGETEGVIQFTKVGSQAWTEGQVIYWDNTNKRFTSASASGLFPCGVAAEAVGAGAGLTLGKVRLNGVSLTAVA